MGACHIQYALLLSLLGFVPCSDSLTCLDGSMVKFGSNLTKEAVDWVEKLTASSDALMVMCQETLVLIDVGEQSVLLWSKGLSKLSGEIKKAQVFSSGPGIVAASYIHFCSTENCNKATSTKVLLDSLSLAASSKLGTLQCPVCLHFKGSCDPKSNLVLCPVNTKCYASSMGIQGGSLSIFLNIFGCLESSRNVLLNNQTSIGVMSVREILEVKSSNSLSHVLVPGTLLTWTLGLSALLSPLCAGISPLC
ncbi:uncharacterized protein LOC292711 isoform X1 [Rattus norvegicus]|uniref:Ly6/PLAUR domain containing 10 n=1 Tax=Rattus norvegicus TaxID=10116 RepID=M0R4W1_RAT|nr:uncharacterized protein LOC292711 precursor [Rattus norvegicus]XP_006228572.1 uncharacterized protein LOC292711 isoform X1 [Rattus norvegicus]XP_008757281.1 uncharacterized protein LOC292711 isoform X1 [Rattus norvegicus]|eukprot:NP_001163800.1 uncharacterized protein LOC292711 precursor [Rattus norvegicus]